MDTSGHDFADRFTGCLLGMAIGDALGVSRAFRSTALNEPGRRRVDEYRPRLDEDGSVEVPAGQYSLNTELALCLLETLVTSDGFVDPELTTFRYLNAVERPDAYLKDGPEAQAIARAVEAEKFQDGAVKRNRRSAGPVVRAVPIALVHSLSDLNVALLTREVLRSVLVTHSDPAVVNGAFGVAYAVRLVVRGEIPREMLIEDVLSLIDEDDVAKALRGGGAIQDPTDVADVVAVALHAFASGAGDLESTVERAFSYGGATHLTGALAGALSGAHLGAGQLPQTLIDGLEGRAYVLMAAPALLRTAQMRAGLFFQLHVR